MRTRVKICGITRAEDALAAAAAGVDAIGLVFYDASPRYVDIPRAQAVCRALPPFVSVTALFVNAGRDWVSQVLEAVPVDVLQFHGAESAGQCGVYPRPYIKAIGMRPGSDVRAVMRAHGQASGFLLDTYQPDTHGGGGEAFDWAQVPAECDRPVILAGGLTPENVCDAIEQARPYAVDVSSGVERQKGIKSAEKLRAFIRGVERGDASRASS